jgi:hypothetical protein
MLPRNTNEYRMTRPDLYPSGKGETDPLARQGHYVRADTEAKAHDAMRKDHPEDSHFTCKLWKTWDAEGKQVSV